jgi:hypothetical protein
MMAFMLKATFLGIFIFGRERVSDRLYFLSSIAAGLGTWLSAVWILIANSCMQTPRGFEIVVENGQRIVKLTDPLAAYLNPRFPYMFIHMQNAAVESVALFMAGVAAYYVFRHHVWGYPIEHINVWEKTLKIALVVLLITAPLQVIQGDEYARHVSETQPQKFAAMEALWETDSYVPEYIVAFPTDVNDLLNHGRKRYLASASRGEHPGSRVAETHRRQYVASNPSRRKPHQWRSSSGRSESWLRSASGSSCWPSGVPIDGGVGNSSWGTLRGRPITQGFDGLISLRVPRRGSRLDRHRVRPVAGPLQIRCRSYHPSGAAIKRRTHAE